MRVGVLVECAPRGLEHIVVPHICDLLRAETGEPVQSDIVPMVNKARLIQECGTNASILLRRACDQVVVLWDERPAWPELGKPLCWHNDRQDILASLRTARVNRRDVHLVCIEREFESWLLHDERMLSRIFSTSAHPVTVSRQRDPERMANPKGTMTKLFRQHRGWRYVDVQYARRFTQCLTDLNRLRRCATFQRFERFLVGPP